MAKIKIAELDINTDALIKATADVKKEIDSLKKANKSLQDSNQGSSQQFVENAVKIKALNKEYNNNTNALIANTSIKKDSAAQTELLNNVLGKEVNTIDEARAQNKALNKLRNEANANTEQGALKIKAINNQLDLNNDFIKENSDQYLKQKINIGNYGSALQGVSPQLAGVLTKIQGSIAGLQAQKAVLQGTTSSLGGTSKALKIFRLALISTGIGALVVAFGSLITFLSTTQAGMDKLTAVTRPLQAIFQSLIGVVQNLGGKLFEAFSNPKQLLTDLVDFVKGQVINRFKALGVVLDGIVNLDFKKISDGLLQGATGVKDLTGKISKAGKDSAKFFADAAAKGAEIDKLTKEIETKEINIARQRQESINAIKDLEKITKDSSATTEARLEANLKQNELAKQQAILEKNIINLKKDRLVIEQDLNDTNREGNKELQQLNADLLAQDAKLKEEELKGIRVISAANKERAAEQKKAIDNAINEQKSALDLFIAQQGIKAKTLQEELAIEEQVSKKKVDILKAELNNKKITKTQFDAAIQEEENNLAGKRAEIAVDNADRELQAYIQNNQSKLDNDKFFSDESLRIEQERIDGIAEKQRANTQIQLEQGVISQTEYNDAINLINEENRVRNEEAELLRKEAKAEADLIDLENQRILDEEKFTTEFDLATERARLRYEAEIAAAEKSGADTTLIKKKYDKVQEDIEKSKQDSKIAAAGATFGVVSDILGKETAAGKAAALAQALINTYQGITAGVALGYPAAIPAVAAAAATGFATVKKITSTPKPKFKQGGGIMQVQGKSHAQGGEDIHIGGKYFGEMEGDEGLGIMNKNAMKHFLAFNNEYNTGTSTATTFAGGAGIISQGVSPQGIDTAELARITQQAVAELPAPIVTVEDINAGQTSVAQVVNGADL